MNSTIIKLLKYQHLDNIYWICAVTNKQHNTLYYIEISLNKKSYKKLPNCHFTVVHIVLCFLLNFLMSSILTLNRHLTSQEHTAHTILPQYKQTLGNGNTILYINYNFFRLINFYSWQSCAVIYAMLVMYEHLLIIIIIIQFIRNHNMSRVTTRAP